MHTVAIAWMFVVLLMALTEATSTQGSVLGALVTLLLYGLLPLGLVLYLMGTPMRRRARRAAEAAAPPDADPVVAEQVVADPAVVNPAVVNPPVAAIATSAADGHGSGEATGAAIAPERKEA